MKAFAYLRVSGRSQVNGDGFRRQLACVRRYAAAKGIEIAAEFRDRGVSGTKELADREGLAALLDALDANGVKTVLVERADRVARDLLVGEVILQQFRALGVSVIAADSGVDLTSPDDGDPSKKLIRQILGAVSEFERNVLVLKMKAGRDRVRRQRGRCEGRKAFGTHPGEHKALARIRELQGQGMGPYQIARKLDSEGVPTRTGKPWAGSTIRRILGRL